MNDALICAKHLSKSYREYKTSVDVLQSIDYSIHPGACVAIVGASGSGKSTLLHLLGGLDAPTQGQVFVQGQDWQKLSEKKRCQLRNRLLGFVYQFHHLLPEFSALENVAMPLLLANESVKTATEEARAMLAQVGLHHRLQHKPSQLSGGERQRVAIARAMVHRPLCILADEPTGNLDEQTALSIFELLLKLNQQFNTALVIVTHDKQLAHQMDTTMLLKHGQLSQEIG